jgi:hypothetical protein
MKERISIEKMMPIMVAFIISLMPKLFKLLLTLPTEQSVLLREQLQIWLIVTKFAFGLDILFQSFLS